MINQKLSPHDIYNYLSAKNYNLSSQKILKQTNPNSDTIWNILTFLSANYPNYAYEQIEPLLVYLLDSEIYHGALKKIKQYINVSFVLSKIYCTENNGAHQFPIKQILRPQKQAILERLSALILFNKFTEKVNKNYEQESFQNKILKNTLKEYHEKLDEKINEIEQIKLIKLKEKQLSDQKIKSIESINKQMAQKKKDKLDLLNSQQQLNNELNKKKKSIDQGQYANDDLQIQIKRLERQIIMNAPKLKKDRISIIQEYEKTQQTLRNKQIFFKEHIEMVIKKLKEVQNIKSRNITEQIEYIYQDISEHQKIMNKMNSNLSNNQNLKAHKLQQKINLIGKIQNRQNQYKKTIQLNDELRKENKKLKQTSTKLQYEIKKYQHIIQILTEKIGVQRAHQEQLKDRFYRKKQFFQTQILQRKLTFEAMLQEAKSIINASFQDFSV